MHQDEEWEHRPHSMERGQNLCSHAEITIQGARVLTSCLTLLVLCDLGLAASPLWAPASSCVHRTRFTG